MNKFILNLPNAKQWINIPTKSSVINRQTAVYGKFKKGFPQGLMLHWPVGTVYSKYSWLKDDFVTRVNFKTTEQIAYARNRKRNTYIIIDWLGGIHQDFLLNECGIHGHAFNSIGIGVEISGPGILYTDKEDEYHASFKFSKNKKRNEQSLESHTPVPTWARRQVYKKDGYGNDGMFMLFSPQQTKAIFRLIFDLVYCDQGNGVYSLDKNTSHEFWARKLDVGGSLFCTIPRMIELTKKMFQGFSYIDVYSNDWFEMQYQIVLNTKEYQSVYKLWRDDRPVWA
jgi:hypothetical protein